ncbi:hypothetical protein B0T17DRAFT_632102 [Bombardia bombarda]|uniref:Uncharacterized protein n=1 Tax=Bombardia bombarda TaxID=252184 RepID=A0AA39X888_9PEZI|nr:hypothetical protein B0T17DRAFT_632102 [Bombardia bombarda]
MFELKIPISLTSHSRAGIMSVASLAPQPKGGTVEVSMMRAATTEASIIIHNPPDFPKDAEILGICGVSEKNADQNKYGWMAADFLAWMTLFHGVGQKIFQTWLSSLDMAKFLESVGSPLDTKNNPFKEVLGKNNSNLGQLPSTRNAFALKTFEAICERAIIADKRKTTLLVMFFGPVTPEQDICVHFGDTEKKGFLTTEKIRQTIREAVGHSDLQVILMTPSPFTGGWMCNPSIFGSAMNPSHSKALRFVSKSCGAAFANRLVDLCTRRSTPLLTAEQRSKVPYEDMTPLRPTELQLNLLHKFQRQIHEALEHRLSDLGKKHGFNFEPQHDTWETYAPRTGRSLVDFWAIKGSSLLRGDTENNECFGFLGEAFGGTRQSQIFHLQYLTTIEVETCPGDWDVASTMFTRELLEGFIETPNPEEDHFKRVFDAIEFRSSSIVLAQIVAKALDLPNSDGMKCRYWADNCNNMDGKIYDKKFRVAFGDVINLFDQVAILPGEIRHDFKRVRFWRACRWLAAAIATKFTSDDEIREVIHKGVVPFLSKIRQTQLELLMEDHSVVHLGRDWIASLSLGITVDTASDRAVAPITKSETPHKFKTMPFVQPLRGSAPPFTMPEKNREGRPALDQDRKDRLEMSSAPYEKNSMDAVASNDLGNSVKTSVEKLAHKATEGYLTKHTDNFVDAPVKKSIEKLAEKLAKIPDRPSKSLVDESTKPTTKKVFEKSAEKPFSELNEDLADGTNGRDAVVQPTQAAVPPSPATTKVAASSDSLNLSNLAQALNGSFNVAKLPEAQTALAKALEIAQQLVATKTTEGGGSTSMSGPMPSSAPNATRNDSVQTATEAVQDTASPDARLVAPDSFNGDIARHAAENSRLQRSNVVTAGNPTPPGTPINERLAEYPQFNRRISRNEKSLSTDAQATANSSGAAEPPQSSSNTGANTGTKNGGRLAAGTDFWSKVKW